MKSKMFILLAGILILASGCARKCPPCPTCADSMGASGSYTNSSFAPAASAPASANYASTSSAPSQYSASSTAKYVSK